MENFISNILEELKNKWPDLYELKEDAGDVHVKPIGQYQLRQDKLWFIILYEDQICLCLFMSHDHAAKYKGELPTFKGRSDYKNPQTILISASPDPEYVKVQYLIPKGPDNPSGMFRFYTKKWLPKQLVDRIQEEYEIFEKDENK